MQVKELTPPQPLRRFIVVLDAHDEFASQLRAFAEHHDIESAYFVGLGAFAGARVAFWSPETMEYEPIEITEQVEVLSLVGNIAWNGPERRIHAHVTVGTRAGAARGGHLLEAHVFPTLELFVTELPTKLQRSLDAATRLPLLALDA